MVAAAVEKRRANERIELGLACEYVIQERAGSDGFMFHQGVGKVLNMSHEGMMLHLGARPRNQQVIEVHLSHPRTGQTVSQVEVLWTNPAEDGKHYLVGCTFVSRPYSPSQDRICAPSEFVSP